MKYSPRFLPKMLAVLAGTVMSSQAAVLFTDNFDATEPGSPNTQITNPGRQGGTIGNVGYLQSGNVQIGNLGTLAPGPDSDLGDEFLAAFAGRAWLNRDFSGATLPIAVTFHGVISSISATGLDNWASFSVGNGIGAPFINGGGVSSVLLRANGETEVWNRGSKAVGGSGTGVGYDVWTEYKIVISDTAGTGSAFTGAGSRMDYYQNGVLLGTLNMTQLGAGEGYFGFAADRIVGYDNLRIETIPEPSAALTSLGSLACLALLRRRK